MFCMIIWRKKQKITVRHATQQEDVMGHMCDSRELDLSRKIRQWYEIYIIEKAAHWPLLVSTVATVEC